MLSKVNMYLCVYVIVLGATIVHTIAEVALTEYLDRGSPCTTPYGENAACISVLSCPGLLELLLTKNETAIEFAVEFQCGYDTEPLVCCRYSDYPPGTFDVFTKPTYISPPYLDTDIENSFPMDDLLELEDCGKETETNRIVSDGKIDINEVPWLVALEYINKYTGENVGIRCGGSIINKKFVLTAAQCVLDREFYITDVWIGDHEGLQKLKVAEFIPHPFYNRRTGNNDIAMLKLATEIQYTDYIQPVCLPHPRVSVPTTQTTLLTTGWETRYRSDSKLKQTAQMIPNYICDKSYQNRQIGPNQICAKGKGIKISYQGDPGGLLLRMYTDKKDQQTRWYQEGISSLNAACGQVGEPLVYTRVSRYIRWIANVIRKDQKKYKS